jgi:8-oxo-dGTP pyrophosphatase MutT (NUDIX family)
MDRSKLPYRKNCEGYFLYKGSYVIANDTGKGYLEFPGGGVDENEEPETALLREAFGDLIRGTILDK